MSSYVFRIVYYSDWERTLVTGMVPKSRLDENDGFVHLSTENTVLETANLYFDPKQQPIVLKLSVASMEKHLRWEWVESRGASFPHLYATISVNSVVSTRSLHRVNGEFVFGEEKQK